MKIGSMIPALISIGLSVAAQFFLKYGMMAAKASLSSADGSAFDMLIVAIRTPQVIIGFILYGLGAMVWLGVLSRYEVSKAYPLVGLGFVLTALIGWCVGENIGIFRLAGIALICAGVFLVGAS